MIRSSRSIDLSLLILIDWSHIDRIPDTIQPATAFPEGPDSLQAILYRLRKYCHQTINVVSLTVFVGGVILFQLPYIVSSIFFFFYRSEFDTAILTSQVSRSGTLPGQFFWISRRVPSFFLSKLLVRTCGRNLSSYLYFFIIMIHALAYVSRLNHGPPFIGIYYPEIFFESQVASGRTSSQSFLIQESTTCGGLSEFHVVSFLSYVVSRCLELRREVQNLFEILIID